MTRGRRDGDGRLDWKGLPIGKRSGFSPFIAGPVVQREFGEGLSIACVPLTPAPRVKNADPQQLKALYEHGARYFQARLELDVARSAALAAANAVSAARDVTAQRLAAAQMLIAANALDAAGGATRALAGLSAVADCATKTASAMHKWAAAELAALPVLAESIMYARDALEALTPAPHPDRMRLSWMQRKLVETGRNGDSVSAPEDRARLDLWESADPLAQGAIGLERLVVLTPPWASVAWIAWLAAGRAGMKAGREWSWEVAWDLWTPLEQCAAGAVGAARGVSGDAVAKTRERSIRLDDVAMSDRM